MKNNIQVFSINEPNQAQGFTMVLPNFNKINLHFVKNPHLNFTLSNVSSIICHYLQYKGLLCPRFYVIVCQQQVPSSCMSVNASLIWA